MKHLLPTVAVAALVLHCGGGDGQEPIQGGDAGSSSGGDAASSKDSGGPHDAGKSPDGSHEGGALDASHDGASSSSGGHDAGGSSSGGPGVEVVVTNGCPFDLWIHATGKEGTLQPDNAHLVQGATQSYQGPVTWTAARVAAYLDAPDSSGNPQGPSDKIEANFYVTNGSQYVNSDITYVDWVALPSEIQTTGTGSDCTTVGCEVPVASILAGCPASLLAGRECLSAGYYCLTSAKAASDPYCHALDAQIAACASQYTDCAAAAGSTTTQVYSCSGAFFGNSPQYCAALNRNVLSAPGAGTPPSAFYQTAPYNTYAKWVHQTCPGIYAFPYDDFGSSNQSSDHTCTGATRMSVTFCPKG